MKKIDENVTIILDAPLDETFDLFESLSFQMENKLYVKAYETLKTIRLFKGPTALVHSNRKEISLEAYEKIINVAKIMMIANILYYSYVEDKKMFFPFEMLPSSKKNAIGKEIEKLLRKLAELKGKVNVKKMLRENMKKKSKLQNLYDSILTVAYPYIRLISSVYRTAHPLLKMNG